VRLNGASTVTQPGTPVLGENVLPARLRNAWWAPLAFVAMVLVVLMGTPVIVSYRVRRLRAALTDGSEEGRAVVNDLEVAIATQMLLRQEVTRQLSPTTADSASLTASRRKFALAVQREHADEAALKLIVRRVGPDAIEQFAQLETRVGEWDAANARASNPSSPSSLFGSDLGPSGPEALNAAERLDADLTTLSLAQRDQIQKLERLDVALALALAPLAVGAAGALYYAGRRLLFFAHTAESRREQLVRVLESKAALLRGVTHDLKNPLGAAYGYGELLTDGVVGPLAPPQQDIVRRVQDLLAVSLGTVNDLMDLYRSETEGLRINSVTLDVAALVATIVEDYTGEARHADIALTTEIRSGQTQQVANTDPVRVRQIVGNLVSNAIKYTPAGGTIAITVRAAPQSKDTIEVEVRDSGPGIDPEFHERIFEEFFRVPGVEGVAGTGVGLAISRRLARMLGGDLTVNSSVGWGSTFTVSLARNVTTQS
jgi:signal transduction histidine kinase